MKSFFKTMLATLLALVIFSFLGFFILIGTVAALGSKEKKEVGANAVLVLDLSKTFPEISIENPLAKIGDGDYYDLPSVYDLVRLIKKAGEDSAVKAILLQCNSNGNGFGNAQEIRNALLQFKKSGKKIFAYDDVISQGGYYLASVADKIYCNPQGGVEWKGLSMEYVFLKGTLEKMEIEPQIFYAGKFKSATEPFRETKMTEANKLQTTVILQDLFAQMLAEISKTRNIDSAGLRAIADEHKVPTAQDAVTLGLIDGLKYEDQLREELLKYTGQKSDGKLNLVNIAKYAESVDIRKEGKDKIALIYAQGNIVDGKGQEENIGSESYRNIIRKARLDKSIKAIVFRVNSGGGSAMASENIWRELSLARKEKPVVLSFGDVAASGGYYLSCNADSIYAQPNTITGSIGVFSLLPNMQKFFNNKLGVTFDGVKTGPSASNLSITSPLTDLQKKWLQADVDSIYFTFTKRVADGRKLNRLYVDSIGQGRIWSGTRALKLGLVDKLGGLQDAIDCAARMAKTTDYRLREFPEPVNFLEKILGNYQGNVKENLLKEELGVEGVKAWNSMKQARSVIGVAQTRLPFEFIIR